jgi:hypothetical protein
VTLCSATSTAASVSVLARGDRPAASGPPPACRLQGSLTPFGHGGSRPPRNAPERRFLDGGYNRGLTLLLDACLVR